MSYSIQSHYMTHVMQLHIFILS